MKEYSQILDYLYGLEKFGMVFGLDNITWLLGLIGNPQDSLKTVHIAGTNGKGSVASMLSEMLRTAGYVTGMYTSPHLISFTERISRQRRIHPGSGGRRADGVHQGADRPGRKPEAPHVLRFHDRPRL